MHKIRQEIPKLKSFYIKTYLHKQKYFNRGRIMEKMKQKKGMGYWSSFEQGGERGRRSEGNN